MQRRLDGLEAEVNHARAFKGYMEFQTCRETWDAQRRESARAGRAPEGEAASSGSSVPGKRCSTASSSAPSSENWEASSAASSSEMETSTKGPFDLSTMSTSAVAEDANSPPDEEPAELSTTIRGFGTRDRPPSPYRDGLL